jgi:hypothetical protein
VGMTGIVGARTLRFGHGSLPAGMGFLMPGPATCRNCGRILSPGQNFCGGCGSSVMADADPTDPYVGRLVEGKYLIEQLLGTGAMGVVYRAKQVSLNKRVAIKIAARRSDGGLAFQAGGPGRQPSESPQHHSDTRFR